MAKKQGIYSAIEWADYSHNPVKGTCPYKCYYCYNKRVQNYGNWNPRLRLDMKELNWLPREPGKIFICDNLDLLHPEIPDGWIHSIIYKMRSEPQNTYQLLSKNPERYAGFEFSENAWLGTTWDGLSFTRNNISILVQNTPADRVRFISFEPLLKEPAGIDLSGIDWIIIGANSNPGARKPPNSWADMLITEARRLDIAVWVKNNYRYSERLKEYPALELEPVAIPVQMALF